MTHNPHKSFHWCEQEALKWRPCGKWATKNHKLVAFYWLIDSTVIWPVAIPCIPTGNIQIGVTFGASNGTKSKLLTRPFQLIPHRIKANRVTKGALKKQQFVCFHSQKTHRSLKRKGMSNTRIRKEGPNKPPKSKVKQMLPLGNVASS